MIDFSQIFCGPDKYISYCTGWRTLVQSVHSDVIEIEHESASPYIIQVLADLLQSTMELNLYSQRHGNNRSRNPKGMPIPQQTQVICDKSQQSFVFLLRSREVLFMLQMFTSAIQIRVLTVCFSRYPSTMSQRTIIISF